MISAQMDFVNWITAAAREFGVPFVLFILVALGAGIVMRQVQWERRYRLNEETRSDERDYAIQEALRQERKEATAELNKRFSEERAFLLRQIDTLEQEIATVRKEYQECIDALNARLSKQDGKQ